MEVDLPPVGEWHCWSEDPGLDGTGTAETLPDPEPEPILREFWIGFHVAAPGPSQKPRYRVPAPTSPPTDN